VNQSEGFRSVRVKTYHDSADDFSVMVTKGALSCSTVYMLLWF